MYLTQAFTFPRNWIEVKSYEDLGTGILQPVSWWEVDRWIPTAAEVFSGITRPSKTPSFEVGAKKVVR